METNISPETTSKLICEACGKKFDCGAEIGKCWCFEIVVDKEILASLEEKFQNCLCPDCLSNVEPKK